MQTSFLPHPASNKNTYLSVSWSCYFKEGWVKRKRVEETRVHLSFSGCHRLFLHFRCIYLVYSFTSVTGWTYQKRHSMSESSILSEHGILQERLGHWRKSQLLKTDHRNWRLLDALWSLGWDTGIKLRIFSYFKGKGVAKNSFCSSPSW